MEQIYIKTDFIKLNAFLKLSGITATGGQANQLIMLGEIKVNDEVCHMKGKKLRENDVVAYRDKKYEVKKAVHNSNPTE